MYQASPGPGHCVLSQGQHHPTEPRSQTFARGASLIDYWRPEQWFPIDASLQLLLHAAALSDNISETRDFARSDAMVSSRIDPAGIGGIVA